MLPPGFEQDYLRPDRLLDPCWRVLDDPRGGVGQLLGPPGCGKTWGLHGLRQEARDRGWPVLLAGQPWELAMQARDRLGLETRPALRAAAAERTESRRTSVFLEVLMRANRLPRLLVLLEDPEVAPHPCPDGATILITGRRDRGRGRAWRVEARADWLRDLARRHVDDRDAIERILAGAGGLALRVSQLARGIKLGLFRADRLPEPKNLYSAALDQADAGEQSAVLTAAAGETPLEAGGRALSYLVDSGRLRYPDLMEFLQADPDWNRRLRGVHERLAAGGGPLSAWHWFQAGRGEEIHPQACWEAAGAMLERGDPAAALELLGRFRGLLWSGARCTVLCQLQRFEEALAVSEELVEPARRAGEVDLLLARARALAALGRQEQALELLEEVLGAAPSPGLLWEIAQLHMDTGHYQQAARSLQAAAAMVDEEERAPYLAARVRPLAADGRWREALECCSQAQFAGHLAVDAGEILRRLGQPDQARGRYSEACRAELLDEEARYRYSILLGSSRALTLLQGQRFQTLRQHIEGTCSPPAGEIVHSLWGTEDSTRLVVAPCLLRERGAPPGPWVERCRELAEAVADFHQREFPGGPKPEVLAPRDLGVGPSFEWIRDALDYGELEDLRRRLGLGSAREASGELADPRQVPGSPCNALGDRPAPNTHARRVDFLVCVPAVPQPYTAGFGSDRTVALRLVPDDPFAATVAAHEFCHAVLELRHTDGWSDLDDPASIMGAWGPRSPLERTYVAPGQKELCLTTARAQDLLSRAQDLERSGELQPALEHYLEVLDEDPRYLSIYRSAARILVRLDRSAQALDMLRRLRQVDGTAESGADLAELLLCLGRHREAERLFRQTPGYGSSESTHLFLAGACLRAAAYGRARHQLEIALGLEPGIPWGLAHLAWAHHGLGHRRKALRLYRMTLRQVPGWGAVRLRLAYLLAQLGQNARADQSLARARTHRDYPYFACLVACERGDWQSARELLLAGPPAPALACAHWHRLGYVSWILGDAPAAIRAFRESQACHRYRVEGQASLAWLEWLEGERDPARRRARKVLRRWSREASCLALLRLDRGLQPAELESGLGEPQPPLVEL
ncbi:MAG: hypothetical protein HY319_25265 [Armatimonadetes bacterium]|nr:hypothetical protein [Armatimonadota bacterium]